MEQSKKYTEEGITTTFKDLINRFILPEIEKRQKNGSLPVLFVLRSAQIVFFPDSTQKIIRLNEEVRAIAQVKVKQATVKKKGEPVFVNEIEDIKRVALTPEDNPDCAHILMSNLGDKWVLSFDFRYNKGLAKKYVNRANEFIDSSEFNLNKKNWGAFVDNLFSASELLATAILLLFPDPKMRGKTNHHMIKTGFNQYAHRGNLKHEYCDVFNDLSDLRTKGRYVGKKFSISEGDAKGYLSQIIQLKGEIDARIK